MQPFSDRVCGDVLGVSVDALSLDGAVRTILGWAAKRESRIVCVCAADSIVTARRSASHAQALAAADMVTPDGAPLAWILRRRGHPDQKRVCGSDLMWSCCREAAKQGTGILLYGGTPATLRLLEQRLRSELPGVNIVGAISPPFRPLSAEEDAEVVAVINRSQARIVWVGLGCPKQEAWMLAHRDRIRAVMVGVGAAFDFHAGTVKRAPQWMQDSGLEWLYRLSQDPRRLAKRYFVGNSVFLLAMLRDGLLFKRAARRG